MAGLLLVVDFDEDDDVVAAFSRWLEHDAPWRVPSVPPGATGVGFIRNLARTPGAWGGWKNPECDLWGGTLNHADLGAVVAWVASAPWKHPGAVQLLLKDQEESYFRVWMIRDGVIRQYAPELPDDDDWVA